MRSTSRIAFWGQIETSALEASGLNEHDYGIRNDRKRLRFIAFPPTHRNTPSIAGLSTAILAQRRCNLAHDLRLGRAANEERLERAAALHTLVYV